VLKKCAAQVNVGYGLLPAPLGAAIATACDEISAGKLDAHFPLVIFQTGSGTQTNMNVNEVREARGVKARARRVAAWRDAGAGPPCHPAACASPPLSR